MPEFAGFVELGESLSFLFAVLKSDGEPGDPTALPTYRVYDADGLVTSGSAAKRDTGVVTGATDASPIAVTSVAHGLTTGTLVTVASVGGNTAANGDFTVTRTGDDTFTLDDSTGNGAYTSGGTWHVTGLYGFTLTPTGNAGYEQGRTYTVLAQATISGFTWTRTFTFTVV
jgi:hypothetical protein